MVYFNMHKHAEFIRMTVVSTEGVSYTAEIPPTHGSRGYFVTYDDLKDASGKPFDGSINEIISSSNFGTEHYKVIGHRVCKIF
jgi:hypothetical protein